MNRDECIQFVANSLSLAMSRDGSSGGVIRLAIIDKDGVTRKVLLQDEQPKFWQG
jgi:20S proteasome subunit beta 1